MIRIHNPNLKTEPTPLESLGALACRVYDPAIPKYRATLCKIDYGGRSAEVNTPLETTNGFTTIKVADFAQVEYVEIGGSIYTEAEDFTAMLPGEYFYNPYTQFLTIRVY